MSNPCRLDDTEQNKVAYAIGYEKGRADGINAIKNDFHKRLMEEMSKPYQNQPLCQALYLGIKRCEWYLDDSKELKE